MKNKNEYFYEKLIEYLECNFRAIEDDGSYRIKTIKALLTKYIRTVKSIKLLEENKLFQEGDILVRSLCEMIMDIAYLEINPVDNYERYRLHSDYQNYKYITKMCEIINIDINTINGISNILQNSNVFENNYTGNKSRWNGLTILQECKEIDKTITTNNIMSFENLYEVIYRHNCFYTHNAGIIINNIYVNLDIEVNENEIYFHNINNLIIISALLARFCLPDLFGSTNIFEEFDIYLGQVIAFSNLFEN